MMPEPAVGLRPAKCGRIGVVKIMERRVLFQFAALLPVLTLLPSVALADEQVWPGPLKIIGWQVTAEISYTPVDENHSASILYEEADGFLRNADYSCPTEKGLSEAVFYGLANRAHTGMEHLTPLPGEGRNPELRRIYGNSPVTRRDLVDLLARS